MAITSSRIRSETILSALRTSIHHKSNRLRDTLRRRKIFRDTLHELSMLSDHDLSDLGIPRSSIRNLAQEAAHDA